MAGIDVHVKPPPSFHAGRDEGDEARRQRLLRQLSESNADALAGAPDLDDQVRQSGVGRRKGDQVTRYAMPSTLGATSAAAGA